MSVDKQTSGLPVCIWRGISRPFSWLFTVQRQIYTDSVYVLYILNYFCMERFREKCVFRGLLFYWYKVSIFNHTQSMRVINYIILKLNHGRDLFSTFTWCHLLCVPLILQSVDEILCIVTIQMKAAEQCFPVVLFITFYKRS